MKQLQIVKKFTWILSPVAALVLFCGMGTAQADTPVAAHGIIRYSCSPDRAHIVGSDGSLRSCNKFTCGSGVIETACLTVCTTSGDCSVGVCDPSDRQCK